MTAAYDVAPGATPAPATAVAVVVNPAKVEDPAALRALLAERCARHGVAEPTWLETTPEDPGAGATRRALAEGAGLVLACGGDGTVRAVAAALAGSGVPLGVLSLGTGNLLARNLDLPRDLPAAVDVALTGVERTLDLGRVGEHRFAAMAGLGLDATMNADAPEGLKAVLGWPAYVVSALRHLRDRPVSAELRVDDGAPVTRRVRTVVVGNVSSLQGGVALLPDADPGDGLLDVVVVAPRSTADWLRVAFRVLARRRHRDARLDHRRGRRVEVRVSRPTPYELDGEPLGTVTTLRVDVEPGALTVRVPRDDRAAAADPPQPLEMTP